MPGKISEDLRLLKQASGHTYAIGEALRPFLFPSVIQKNTLPILPGRMPSTKGKSAVKTPLLYKLVHQALWEKAQKVEFWAGSPDDLRDGFIHLSTREQLAGTLREHLAGESSVLVLGVDVSGPDLHWEASRNGLLFEAPD